MIVEDAPKPIAGSGEVSLLIVRLCILNLIPELIIQELVKECAGNHHFLGSGIRKAIL